MKKIAIFFLVCFCFLCGCGQVNILEKVAGNIHNYAIDMKIDCVNKKVVANEKVDYINNTEIILKEIRFHLYPNAFKNIDSTQAPVSEYNFEKAYPNGFDSGYIEIKNVSYEKNQDAIYEIVGDEKNILVVKLQNELYPQDRCEVNIEFEVKIPNVIHRFGYGENTINLGNFYPIACVYENGSWKQDGYHYNGDPFYSEMANYNVNIEYNEDYNIATTGECKVSKKNNKNIASANANVVRDFAIVLSNKFEVIQETFNDILISYMYYADENVNETMQLIKDAIQTFEGLIGDYPYKTLTVVQSNFLHGGMEYPNLVLISDVIANRKDYFNVVVHEIAHQWFYNIIGNDEYSEAWLDEGLTEYVTTLFFGINQKYGIDYNEVIGNMLSSYQLFVEIYTDVFGELDTSMDRPLNAFRSEPEYTYCVYIKGVLMLDHLKEMIGESAFYMGLKNYYNDNKFKIARKDNFISAFQRASNKDISGIIKSWIDGSVVLQKI